MPILAALSAIFLEAREYRVSEIGVIRFIIITHYNFIDFLGEIESVIYQYE